MASELGSGNPFGIHRAPNKEALEERRIRALELRVRGYTIAQIVREVGVTGKMVTKDIQMVLEARAAPATVQGRRMEDARLEALHYEGWQILTEATDPELKLKAIDRLLRVAERRSKLHGYDAPTRADVTVFEQTEQDRELEEMLREAKMRSSAILGEIVRESTPTEQGD